MPVGIGCGIISPIALFGTLMIADYPGPESFTEYFGWWALCLLVAVSIASFLRRFREGGSFRYMSLLLFIAVPLGFAALVYADIHPDTPQSIKGAVEASLRIFGVPAIGLLLAFVGWIGWNSRKA